MNQHERQHTNRKLSDEEVSMIKCFLEEIPEIRQGILADYYEVSKTLINGIRMGSRHTTIPRARSIDGKLAQRLLTEQRSRTKDKKPRVQKVGSKMSVEKAKEMRQLKKERPALTLRQIANHYDVSLGLTQGIIAGRIWHESKLSAYQEDLGLP